MIMLANIYQYSKIPILQLKSYLLIFSGLSDSVRPVNLDAQRTEQSYLKLVKKQPSIM